MADYQFYRNVRSAERHLENDYDHLDKDGGGVHGGEEQLTQLNLKL